MAPLQYPSVRAVPAAADAGRAVDDEARRHAAHAQVADRPLVQPVVLEVGPALRRRDGPGGRRVDAAGRALYGLVREAVGLRHARVVEHRGERVELVERLARLDPRSRVDGDERRDAPRPVQRVELEHQALRRRAQQLPEPRRAALADGAPQCCVGQLRALASQKFWRWPGLVRRFYRRRLGRRRRRFCWLLLLLIWRGRSLGRRRWWRWFDGRRRRERGWWSVGRRRRRLQLVQRRRRREGSRLLALLPLAPREFKPGAPAEMDVDDQA